MPNFTTTFTYNLGETVGLKNAPDHRLLILERIAQECPGGVQHHYKCRVVIETGIWKTITATGKQTSMCRDLEAFNEIELEPVATGEGE